MIHPLKVAAVICATFGVLGFAPPGHSEPEERRARPVVAPKAQLSNDSDRLFARQAARNSLGEVSLGRFAKDRASRPDVRQFAAQMVEIHDRIGDELAALAKAAKISLPRDIGPTNMEKHNYLKTFSGPDFDREYVKIQIADHQQAIRLFEWLADAGQDPAMKKYAAGRLPMLNKYLEKANEIQARIMPGGDMAGASDARSAGMDGAHDKVR